MASEPQTDAAARHSVEMPRPTAAPLVLGLGLALLAAGVVFGSAFLVVGALVIVIGLVLWIAQLLPGRGHVHEPLAGPAAARPVTAAPGRVEHLQQGMPGYRLRLPQDVHPISAGLKGGIAGGVVMPVPALLWGLLSGHGPWYPVNLLAGMAVPGVDKLTEFQPNLLLMAVVIHAVVSVIIGLIYGVLLPTLPKVPTPIAWGGLLMPIVWTGVIYVAMSAANPELPGRVSWPWFLVSQFVFGVTMPAVVLGLTRWPRALAGPAGGLVGGVAMALPALAWSAASGHGLWYPVNLLAGLVRPEAASIGAEELGRFHPEWFVPALVVHVAASMLFGLVFVLAIPRLPPMPAPLAWGGLVLPLLWTGTSYGLMGVVNPVLQERVDWAWFVVSQFVFGVAAAVVVLRSETVRIPPAGRGPDRVADFVTGDGGGQS
jgi:hypothetical protein